MNKYVYIQFNNINICTPRKNKIEKVFIYIYKFFLNIILKINKLIKVKKMKDKLINLQNPWKKATLNVFYKSEELFFNCEKYEVIIDKSTK